MDTSRGSGGNGDDIDSGSSSSGNRRVNNEDSYCYTQSYPTLVPLALKKGPTTTILKP